MASPMVTFVPACKASFAPRHPARAVRAFAAWSVAWSAVGGACVQAARRVAEFPKVAATERVRLTLREQPPRCVTGTFDSCDSAHVRIWNIENRVWVRTLCDRATVAGIERALSLPPAERHGAGYHLAGGVIAGAGLGFCAGLIADLSELHNSGGFGGGGGVRMAQGLALGAVIGGCAGLWSARSQSPETRPPERWEPARLPDSCARQGQPSAGRDGVSVGWTI